MCPLYHSAAPGFVLIMLSLGATVVLMNHFDAEGALDIIQREQITSTLMVPTMLVRIANLPTATLGHLRHVEPALGDERRGAARRPRPRAGSWRSFGPVLWNFYGSTETGLVTMAGPGDHVTRPGTIGKPLRGNEIRLLDDAGHPVPRGQVGELYARNSTLMSGYHNNDDATSAAQREGSTRSGTWGGSTKTATTSSRRASTTW